MKTIRVENFMCHEHLKVDFKCAQAHGISGASCSRAFKEAAYVHHRHGDRHASPPTTRRPSVNFISGTNGSGKSATLQALQFCLGVAARHTGRGHGAKDLIKYGARQLVACVTLWNTGVWCQRCLIRDPKCDTLCSQLTVDSMRLATWGFGQLGHEQ